MRGRAIVNLSQKNNNLQYFKNIKNKLVVSNSYLNNSGFVMNQRLNNFKGETIIFEDKLALRQKKNSVIKIFNMATNKVISLIRTTNV